MAQRTRPEDLITAKGDHEWVMLPLAGKGTNLEIALAYLRQVVRRMPACAWQLDRAIAEIEEAREAIRESQMRAVERWRNFY